MRLTTKGVKLLIQGLINCKLLKHLDIGANNIDDGAIDDILLLVNPYSKSSIKLKELKINDNRLTSVGCSKLLS